MSTPRLLVRQPASGCGDRPAGSAMAGRGKLEFWRWTLGGLALLAATGQAEEAGGVAHDVDHLVLGIADLERGTERLTRLTGVQPLFGGEHPGQGTHNALLSLGPGVYLEVLAPRPGAEAEVGERMAGLSSLQELTPVMWAISTTDADATRRALAAVGVATTELVPGSRLTPLGSRLEWVTFTLAEPPPGAPFLIQWSGETPHPSGSSPGGCGLRELTVATPAPEALRRLIATLGLDVVVIAAAEPNLEIVLDCPAGEVAL